MSDKPRALSEIYLYKNSPFDETYKHLINWTNQDNLVNFLDTLENYMQVGGFQSVNKPLKIDTKILDFQELLEFNYIRIKQRTRKGNEKNFFAFISNIEYINDGVSFVYFSLDIWNTYKFNAEFNRAYIKRSMLKDYDNGQVTQEFKKYCNQPEDIGGDGCSKLQVSQKVWFTQFKNGNYYNDGVVRFILFTHQPKEAKDDPGTFAGAYSQYAFSFIAYNTDTEKCFSVFKKDGTKVVDIDDTNIRDAYQELSTTPEFAGSSSLVVDAEQFAYLGIPFHISNSNKSVVFDEDIDITATSKFLARIVTVQKGSFKHQTGIGQKPDGYKDGNFVNFLYKLFTEKYGACPLKILGSPYSKITFTNGRGTLKDLNFLNFNNLDQKDIRFRRYGGVTNDNKEMYSIVDYNQDENNIEKRDLIINNENNILIDDSPKDTPIILDNYTMFLNSNRNQLANTRANAKMNMLLSKEGNTLSLNNTIRNINNSNNVMNYSQGREMGMAQFNAMTGVIGGAASGAMSGGLVGGVMGAVGGAINGGLNLYKTGYNQETARNVQHMNNATQLQNSRANYAFQNKIATNNYEQTIRNQNAMLADTKNHNDVIAHQGSNYLFDLQNGNSVFRWQLFTCQQAIMLNAILYFKLFGYTINDYLPLESRFNICNIFNYIRAEKVSVTGKIPSFVITAINNIFENGTTLWNDNNKAIEKFKSKDQTYNTFN